jgi:16S rRNA (uracil1498-N3)-methyltransferase
MHHFFVDAGDVSNTTVELHDAEAHHASRVLRVSLGERISVADGSGRVIEAVVTEVGSIVRADIRDERNAVEVRPAITLYQAVAKGERMETLVQKAVEVGVRRIVPLITERTVVRWNEPKRAKACDRWTEIARAAAKQCRSPWLTRIEDVRDGVRISEPDGPHIVLESSAACRLREVLPPEAPESLGLTVGPEGGLTAGELEAIAAQGGVVATLGERVLRTETAGPVAAALVLYAYGSLG